MDLDGRMIGETEQPEGSIEAVEIDRSVKDGCYVRLDNGKKVRAPDMIVGKDQGGCFCHVFYRGSIVEIPITKKNRIYFQI